MALSQDLINQFVKLTDKEEKPKEVTVNGTYKMINGEEYVQIDGSEIWTPVTSTVEAETGERVKVMIKNHTATVTGNISSPSARSKSVKDLKDEVDEQGNTIKQLDNSIEQQNNSIIQIDNNIKQVNNDILQANNAINQQGNIIKQLGNEINQQGDVINSMNNDITANNNEITAINNTIVQQNNTITQHGNTIEQQENVIRQQGNEINQHGNKIDQLDNDINQQGNAITQINNKIVQQDNVIQQQGNIIDQQDNIITEHGNNITILNSGFSIIDGVLVGLSQAIIDELKTKHLDAEYATIDFANINMAAVTKLFTESGIIKDLVVQEGKITGELVGVTIKGDLIEGNTIAAEKLVVKGSDGLYYKLNIDGLNNISTDQASKFVLLDTKPEDWESNYKDYYLISDNNYIHITGNQAPTWKSNTYYKLSSTYESGLDGSNIVAKSITADKVSVTDLVAFGATIGGFNISQHSIYSGGKSSVDNVSPGFYMDDKGQITFGDNKNFIKFFKDKDNQFKLRISANEIYTESNSKSIAEQMEELAKKENSVTHIEQQYAENQSTITAPTDGYSTTKPNKRAGYYIWQKTITTYGDNHTVESTPVCISGLDGANGTNGKDGKDGTNGKTSYFHIKYSAKANPTSSADMSETPNTYIGTYVDFIEADSTDPTKYTWSQFKGSQGAKGDQGIPGTNGTNGKTSYLHIAYANSADGQNGFSVSDSTNKLYIGQYTDFTQADSTDPSKYSWTLIKGDKGATGAKGDKGDQGVKGDTGNGIKSTAITYQGSTSGTTIPTGTWATTIPTVAAGSFLWTRTVITYTNNSTTTSYSVGKMGNTGATGATGKGVKSAATTYQAASNGTTIPTGTWSTSVPKTTAALPYLWSRTITTYTDNSTSTAYAIGSTPEGITVGGRNLVPNSTYICTYNVGSSTQWGINKQIVSVIPGETYTLSQYYNGEKTNGTNTHGYAYAYAINGKGIKLSGDYMTSGAFNNSTRTIDSNIVKLEVYTGGIKDCYINDIYQVKLEKGNKSTDWTPAPEDMNDAIKSVVNLYYSSNSSTLPAKPTTHVTTNNTTTRNAWNISLPTYDEQYPYLYTCKEVLNKGGTYSWTTVNQTTYSEAIKTIQTELDAVQADYLKESTFSTYKREQIKNDQKIEQRLSKTEVTVYGDPENPDDPTALINHIQKVDNDINGSGGLDNRLGAAEGIIEGTGLNEYDQRVKITQRFLNVETDVESIKNIFNITGGTNLIQNSVGYFASNNKPSMWDIASNTIYTPFGYDGDLTGVTVSRGKLFCAKGSITTTTNNIIALLSNKMVSISFKYKNGANATSKIKIFNGSIIYFEKTFNTTVNQWTEYKFNPDTDPILANPTFLNISNSLQISIESTNSTNNNGFEISDLILNYGNVKPWELSSNEVYGAMVKLSSLGIEVTATTANTKNFMTTDGILVYRYDSKTDKIIGSVPITKITDNGTITNKLESTGDIIERNLIQTMIKDSSNKDIYVEYIR